MTEETFVGFPKMARLRRECIITEKIDGTQGQVYITEEGKMLVGTKNRWISPEDDNYGFAKWAREHEEELMQLGPGHHTGEWWGQGIQRKYGMTEKRWSLFNTIRWCLHGGTPARIPKEDPRIEKYQDVLPACCHLVPVLYRGVFSTEACNIALFNLKHEGSKAAPGYLKPEGLVVYHLAANICFKQTLEADDVPKNFNKTACQSAPEL